MKKLNNDPIHVSLSEFCVREVHVSDLDIYSHVKLRWAW
jgi:hypothetical protein